MYDFKNAPHRKNQGCIKWDKADALYGCGVAENLLPMWIADMDFAVAPPIVAALQKRVQNLVFGYDFLTDEYYEAVIGWMKRRHNYEIQKEWITFTPGIVTALHMAVNSVTEPGDEVLLPSPGYGLYYNCAAIADAQVRAYALKAPDFGWGGAEAGERTKMLFINSPHNPTGAVLSKEELGQIADFAKANNLLVVSDEAYDRLLYDGLEHRSIASEPGMRDRTVILGSFSKTYSMTGWRIGYLAGPAEVIRGMALLQQSFVLSVNSFAQWGAVEAMTGPQDCVEEMRQQFDIRRKAMMEALSTIPNVSFAAPKGAFYIYLNHEKTGLDPVQFCAKLLDEYYVACVPGSEYGPYAGCNTRLSCATGLDDCLEGVDRIRKMVASL